jgi:hypothetical protein
MSHQTLRARTMQNIGIAIKSWLILKSTLIPSVDLFPLSVPLLWLILLTGGGAEDDWNAYEGRARDGWIASGYRAVQQLTRVLVMKRYSTCIFPFT